ncbi:MAG: class I SAM-dependent methyltransferase [Bauldia sp.]
MERRELSKAYTGAVAADYEDRRSQSGKWQAENETVRGLLADLTRGGSILDVPVGTGRFLGLYREAGLAPVGADVSSDMLREAAKASEAPIPLLAASIFALPFRSGGFDAALCIRLLNWLSASDLRLAVAELARVSRRHVIVGIRSHARKAGLVDALFGRRSPAPRAAGSTNAITVHDKADIAGAFRAADLAVVRETVVPHGRPGTDYVFYLLRRA